MFPCSPVIGETLSQKPSDRFEVMHEGVAVDAWLGALLKLITALRHARIADICRLARLLISVTKGIHHGSELHLAFNQFFFGT